MSEMERATSKCPMLTIFVLNKLRAFFSQDIVHIDEIRMTRISHSVVRDKDYINYLCQIPCNELVMQVFRKCIDIS